MQVSARERAIVRNRLRQYRNWGFVREQTDLARLPGRFRKRHPLDCGRAHCLCCHYDKLCGVKSVKQRRSDEAAVAELEEFWAEAERN